jgi:hypothetical protein
MKQRMKEPYEKGVAIRSASSLARGIARYSAKRLHVSRGTPTDCFGTQYLGYETDAHREAATCCFCLCASKSLGFQSPVRVCRR